MSGTKRLLRTLDRHIAEERARRDSAWQAVGHDWAYSLQHERAVDALIAARDIIAARSWPSARLPR